NFQSQIQIDQLKVTQTTADAQATQDAANKKAAADATLVDETAKLTAMGKADTIRLAADQKAADDALAAQETNQLAALAALAASLVKVNASHATALTDLKALYDKQKPVFTASGANIALALAAGLLNE